MTHYRIGMDIGGTSIKIALLNEEWKIVKQKNIATLAHCSLEEQLSFWQSQLEIFLTEIASESRNGLILGAGVGVPGLLDASRRKTVFLPNIPQLVDFPLADWLEKILGFAVRLENDVNAFVWGEYRAFWANYQSLVAVVIGTGIGGGIVLDGKLYLGQGNAAEIGHIPIFAEGKACACGGHGCWEQYASIPALLSDVHAQITQKLSENDLSPFWQNYLLTNNKTKQTDLISSIDGKLLFEAAKANDPIALAAWENLGYYLSIGIIGLAHTLHPDVIVIGGGVLPAAEFFLPSLLNHFSKRVMPVIGNSIQLVTAKSGNMGVFGCAHLVDNII